MEPKGADSTDRNEGPQPAPGRLAWKIASLGIVACAAGGGAGWVLGGSGHGLVAWAAGAGVANAILLAGLLRWVIRPARRLVRAARHASAGRLAEGRIPEEEIPRDELGGVMMYQNRMLERMESTLEELRAAKDRVREATHDIREHKEKLHENYLVVEAIKDDLEETNRRLREVDRLRSEFLAAMAHELRAPIHAITGFTELTLKTQKGLNGRGRSNLEKVIRSGFELARLVSDILDLSKLEAGRIAIQTEEFNLGELIDECLSTVDPLLLDRDVRIEVRLEGDFRRIRQDRGKLRQMVLNLLGNAAKFTEKGTITVSASTAGREELSWGERSPQETFLKVAVADTGIGIAEEHLERIFEQFAQVDEVASGHLGGTGLGLYIVKRFARLLGGEALVESRPGRGSTFSVVVPMLSTKAVGEARVALRPR